MATKTLYPSAVRHTTGRDTTAKTQAITNISSLRNSNGLAQWGASPGGQHVGCNANNTLRNYCKAIGGKNGSWHTPETIELDYKAGLPDNANVSQIAISYEYARRDYSNGNAHGTFAAPTIKLSGTGISFTGNAPPKQTMTTYTKTTSVNLTGKKVNDMTLTFNLPKNTSTNPCYILIRNITVKITYLTAKYTPSITLPSPLKAVPYGETIRVNFGLKDTNNAVPSATISTAVTIKSGFKVDKVVSSDGTATISGNVINWNASTKNYNANLIVDLTPLLPSSSGNHQINFKENNGGTSDDKYITAESVKYSCNGVLSIPSIQKCVREPCEETKLTLIFKTSSKLNTSISTNINIPPGLKVKSSTPGNINNGVYSFSSWDSSRQHTLVITLTGNNVGTHTININSAFFTEVLQFPVTITEWEPPIDPVEGGVYYTALRADTFTQNMLEDGKEYTFSCLMKYDGERLYNGAKNLRMAVLNGETPVWSEQLSQLNKWEELKAEFIANTANPLEFQFFGDYGNIKGIPQVANPCIIKTDKYSGYEYPIFTLQPLENLLNGSDLYASLTFDPPEKKGSSWHYLSSWNIEDLLASENIIIQGIGLEFDCEFDKDVGVTVGLGEFGNLADTDEVYKQSKIIKKDETHVVFGGKYKNWGVPYKDLKDFLNRIEATIKLEERFDGISPFEVSVKNVALRIYYGPDVSDGCGFSIDGTHSKYFSIKWNNGTIPQGANFDVNTLIIKGGDGETNTGAYIRNKVIQIDFTFDSDTFQDLQTLKNIVIDYLTPQRDRTNQFIPKRIVFDHEPNIYYEYILDDTIEMVPDGNSYKCSAKLIIEKGLATSVLPVTNTQQGNIDSYTRISPIITIMKQTDNLQEESYIDKDPFGKETKYPVGSIVVKDSITKQTVILSGNYIQGDKIQGPGSRSELKDGTIIRIDSENYEVHFLEKNETDENDTLEKDEIPEKKHDERWRLIPQHNISMISTFFELKGQFNFKNSVGCSVREIEYHELL